MWSNNAPPPSQVVCLKQNVYLERQLVAVGNAAFTGWTVDSALVVPGCLHWVRRPTPLRFDAVVDIEAASTAFATKQWLGRRRANRGRLPPISRRQTGFVE